jgi:hypothetical protein
MQPDTHSPAANRMVKATKRLHHDLSVSVLFIARSVGVLHFGRLHDSVELFDLVSDAV